jgi:hypothetical protein
MQIGTILVWIAIVLVTASMSVPAVIDGLHRYRARVKRARHVYKCNRKRARHSRAPSPQWEVEVDGAWYKVESM